MTLLSSPQEGQTGKSKNYCGRRFGRLFCESLTTKNGRKAYECRCVCGTRRVVEQRCLVTGNTQSCGCLAKESRGRGHGGTPKRSEGRILGYLRSYYKSGAKRRGMDFALTKEVFNSLVKSKCYYCGSEGKLTVKYYPDGSESSLVHNGIDRTDNSVGYTPDNCVPCCRTCNFAKGSLTSEEFKAWARNFASNIETWT